MFRQLAELAVTAGHCLVITDADGILVRLESQTDDPDWNEITLGSVWDERVAGTNGVSMALGEGRDITVRGADHFYTKLRSFACSAVPLRNAENEIIGAANLSSVDRGNPADSMFARQLLMAAASRIQHALFEQTFKDQSIISVSDPERRELIKGPELVAVDSNGIILGSTKNAFGLVGLGGHCDLLGKSFDAVFEADMTSLDKVPGRVLSVRHDQGRALDLWRRAPVRKARSTSSKPSRNTPQVLRKQGAFSLKDIGIGSVAMRALCDQIERSFDHGLPVLIEGETGTGKTALVAALLGNESRIITVNCATLEDTDENRYYVRSLIEQAGIARALDGNRPERDTLIFDNIDEMPMFGQAALRDLLDELGHQPLGRQDGVHIIATSRHPLQIAVYDGRFRDDLYFMLSGAAFVLPPLRHREGSLAVAKSIATQLAGREVAFSKEAADAISADNWPGNLRELRGVLQQALLRGEGGKITALDLGRSSQPIFPVRTSPAPHIPYNEEQMVRVSEVSAYGSK